MTYSSVRLAMSQQQFAIDEMAARLVRQGVPPYIAMAQASQIIRERSREYQRQGTVASEPKRMVVERCR